MTYPEAVGWLESLCNYERTGFVAPMSRWVNLNTMRALLALLGDPQDGLRFLHIAGSKGKGSVAAMAEAILRAAGWKTGLFTSPHLVSVRERIRVAGQRIAPDRFAWLAGSVRPAVEELSSHPGLAPVTYYEAVTAMAMLGFAAERTDLVVLETGLGGRLDATNLVHPTVCLITRICLEHTAVLGNTLAEIAAEKAGIIKPGVPVVLGAQPEEAWAVLEQRAREVGAPIIRAPDAQVLEAPSFIPGTRPRPQTVVVGQDTYELALLGDHQVENAALAVAAADALTGAGLDVPREAVAEGLRTVEWPGRLQVVPGQPMILLDCAHAPAAAAALAEAINRYFRCARVWLVLGMADDKDVEGFAAELVRLRPTVIATAAQSPRAVPPASLA
ncbi:MAG: Mur ligase family protein, partial [Armatimonadetes bacterium]|nr:Mur ligase family protein [Armatimonadota bacterium]